MKKQIILLALLLSVAASAFAEEAEINGLWYELVSKTKEAKVIQDKNYVKYRGNIVIPETVEYNGADYSVRSIGSYAFYDCSSLTSVTIPNSVTSIGNETFWYCSGLTSVMIPNSVTSIGNEAFCGCSSLTSVHISDIAAWCKIAFSNSYSNPLLYAHHLYLGEDEITDLVIPNSVTSIGNQAFLNCSGLTSVTIPNSVTSIGNDAFYNCSGLTSVTIPNSVTRIGEWAFCVCSGLTSVTIPNSVTSIGNGAFRGCSSLTSVTIGNSVTSIGEGAFSGCSGLTSVTIGSGVRTIYEKSFAKCPELVDVYCYAESVPSTNANAFEDSYIDYATLHVPTASIDAYKAKEPWKNFKTIMGLDGTMPDEPEVKKCATPTIAFVDGELEFSCETEGVEYVSEVTSKEVKKYYDSKVKISGTYTVTVYATKAGYDNSDVATKEFTVSASGEVCDVNQDGTVDVADIATIISKMAGK